MPQSAVSCIESLVGVVSVQAAEHWCIRPFK
jgi:hypothetical protein